MSIPGGRNVLWKTLLESGDCPMRGAIECLLQETSYGDRPEPTGTEAFAERQMTKYKLQDKLQKLLSSMTEQLCKKIVDEKLEESELLAQATAERLKSYQSHMTENLDLHSFSTPEKKRQFDDLYENLRDLLSDECALKRQKTAADHDKEAKRISTTVIFRSVIRVMSKLGLNGDPSPAQAST